MSDGPMGQEPWREPSEGEAPTEMPNWGQPAQPSQPGYGQQQWAPPGQPAHPGSGAAAGHDLNQFGAPPGPSVDNGSVQSGFPLSRIGLIATVVVLAGLGGFALWRALSSPGGPATPEEAASQTFDSFESEDILSVVEVMLPSERESMVEPFTDVMIELARLDVVADETVDGDELHNFTGVTIDFPDEGRAGALVYEVQPIGTAEHLRRVTVTDGQMTVTFDPQALQDGLGEQLSDLYELEADLTSSGIETEVVDLGDEYDSGQPLEFVVVEEDGSWYLSLWYTVAGFATDFEAPDLALAPTPAGGSSPEEVAALFIENLIEFDMLTTMTMLDPDEFRAAYDFWGHYGPDLASQAADVRVEAQRDGFDWEVRSVSAASEERNGRRLATIEELVLGFVSTSAGAEADLTLALNDEGLRLDGTIQGGPVEVMIGHERATGRGTIEGEAFEFDIDLLSYEGFAEFGPDRFQFSRDDDCFVITTNGESERLCSDDFGSNDPMVAFDFQQDYQRFADELGTPGLTMVERDGRWYVSAFPTYGYAIVDFLKTLEKEELDEIIDSYVDFLEGLNAPSL